MSICANSSPRLLNPGQVLCTVSVEVLKVLGAGVFDLFSSIKQSHRHSESIAQMSGIGANVGVWAEWDDSRAVSDPACVWSNAVYFRNLLQAFLSLHYCSKSSLRKKTPSLWQQLGKSCDYVSNARKQMGLDAFEWLIILRVWGWKNEWKQRWVFLFSCLHLKWYNLLSVIVFL